MKTLSIINTSATYLFSTESSIPHSVESKKQSAPWYNSLCAEFHKMKCYRVFKKNPTETNRIMYKKAASASRRFNRETMNEYISNVASIKFTELEERTSNFCSSISSDSDSTLKDNGDTYIQQINENKITLIKTTSFYKFRNQFYQYRRIIEKDKHSCNNPKNDENETDNNEHLSSD
ncbi:hypothetical protein Avbf_01239 [Armadillidium vulgare]|nr:hypothetical protein Avbf_01239 [Armadillidium vulgare]